MYITFDLVGQVPPGFAVSYGAMQYGIYGRGWWLYAPGQLTVDGLSVGSPGNIYAGEVEWINSQHWLSYPKYENPYAFQYNLARGVIMTAQAQVTVSSNAAS